MDNRFHAPADAWKGEATFIIGGGPSIRDFNCDRLRGKGRVIAVNDAGLYKAPWADVLFWADQRWLEWNHKRLALHTGGWKVTRKRPHLETGHDIKVMRFLPRGLSHHADAVGGWCGGSSSINLAYLLGSRVIVLMGFDMRPGNWHSNHKMPPVPNQHREKFIPTIEALAPQLLKAGVTVINTNPKSALRCFPFADIEELLAMDDLATLERDKYLAVWQRDEYRRISPGMLERERAFAICEMRPGQSLIDFGSGPARATKWFEEQGLNVIGIDIAPNAKETDVSVIEACLWDLPECIPPADYGYSCDVLEHIPTEKVDAVLGGIAGRVKRAAYFRIATRPDRMGPMLLKQPLHLTVKSGEWWRRKVEEHFPLVDVIENSGRDVILLARP